MFVIYVYDYEDELWDGVKIGLKERSYCTLEVIKVLKAVRKEMGALFCEQYLGTPVSRLTFG